MTVLLALCGCVRFHPEPVSPAQTAAAFERRSLTNDALKTSLETNLHREFADWPRAQWDFDMLTYAAYYYHPDLDVARAQWNVARAGIKSAGGRPNPTLGLTPGYNTTTAVPSPWLPAVNFDVPIETAGKRGKRMAVARELSESARLNLATVAWQVRSRLRLALLDSAAARQRVRLLREQLTAQEQTVKLLEQQAAAGAIAGTDLTTARVALQKASLDLGDGRSREVEARVRLAAALGISSGAPDESKISFDPLTDGIPFDVPSAEVRRAALQNRSDILGALADYAAAQATLQLEIAKQYPDVHLNPGYQYDQGDNKWSLGIMFELPVLNQNHGPIAEAAARRQEAAARFNALQAKVVAGIELAVEVFRINQTNAAALHALAEAQARQRKSVDEQVLAGAADQLQSVNARFEAAAAALMQLDGQVKLQQAAAALEDAVQRPMDLPAEIFESNRNDRRRN